MTPPILIPTPGAGESFNPEIVDKLIANQKLFLDAWAFYQKVTTFFAALYQWKADAIQSVANNQPVRPVPVPPVGLIIPTHLLDVPALPRAPSSPITPGGRTVVEPEGNFGTYPAPFDENPAGTVIANPYIPGGNIRKVIGNTPFGKPMWWEKV